jgi:hypothetical protein
MSWEKDWSGISWWWTRRSSRRRRPWAAEWAAESCCLGKKTTKKKKENRWTVNGARLLTGCLRVATVKVNKTCRIKISNVTFHFEFCQANSYYSFRSQVLTSLWHGREKMKQPCPPLQYSVKANVNNSQESSARSVSCPLESVRLSFTIQ